MSPPAALGEEPPPPGNSPALPDAVPPAPLPGGSAPGREPFWPEGGIPPAPGSPGFDEDGSPGKPGGLDKVGKVGTPGAAAGDDGDPPWPDCEDDDGPPAGLDSDGDPPEPAEPGAGIAGDPLWPDCEGDDGPPAGFDGEGSDGDPPELDELGEGIAGDPLEPEEPWEGIDGGVGKLLPLGGLGGEVWGGCEIGVGVSQAASPAIRPQASASRIREAELFMKSCISPSSRVDAMLKACRFREPSCLICQPRLTTA